jgi:prepilin-type processing-associated H-X9-DG protein
MPFMDQTALYNKIVKATTASYSITYPAGTGNTPDTPTLLLPKGGTPNLDPFTGTTNINVDQMAGRMQMINAAGHPSLAARVVLSGFVCPSDILPATDNDGYGKSNYVGSAGSVPAGLASPMGCGNLNGGAANGVLLTANNNNNTWVVGIRDIKDGTANTFLVGECTESANVSASNTADGAFPTILMANNNGGCNSYRNAGNGTRLAGQLPNPVAPQPATLFSINNRVGNESNACFGSQHAGGAHFLMCDGTVRFINQNIDYFGVYALLGARNDKQSVSDF